MLVMLLILLTCVVEGVDPAFDMLICEDNVDIGDYVDHSVDTTVGTACC